MNTNEVGVAKIRGALIFVGNDPLVIANKLHPIIRIKQYMKYLNCSRAVAKRELDGMVKDGFCSSFLVCGELNYKVE